MTEQTDNEALVEELARAICHRSVHWGDAEGVVQSRVDAEWKGYIKDAQGILPIITRRDAETWNRAIEAAERACLKLGFAHTAKTIARLKDHPQ